MPQLDSSEGDDSGAPLNIDHLREVFRQYQNAHPELQWLPQSFAFLALLRVPLTGKIPISELPDVFQALVQTSGGGECAQKIHEEPVIFLSQTMDDERLVCMLDEQNHVRRLLRVPAGYVYMPMQLENVINTVVKEHTVVKDQQIAQLTAEKTGLQAKIAGLHAEIAKRIREEKKSTLLMLVALLIMMGIYSCDKLKALNAPQEAEKVGKKEEKGEKRQKN